MTSQTHAQRRILIANRGEIATRIVRAINDSGGTSIAIYAEPDANALHVNLADEAYAIGGQTGADSYLSIEKVIDAARRSKADAVHPGYGFLSENADFAQAVVDAGLTWIGPSPEAIRALGDKVTAREIAMAADAPLVPGTSGAVSGVDEVFAFVETHGLPIAIKASYGGGGRGMKVVRDRNDIQELYDSATREAVAAFGRGECYVERYLDNPRHVEAQILADHHGNVVVVGTRDCSLQRRFQKLVEEAPAPFLTEEQHDQILTSAKAIVRKAKYYGAGTVEYLIGRDGLISFLEVNTRLQVEHSATEEAFGVDLVEAQLEIAYGEKLKLVNDAVPQAHAIEFRINAEDVGRGFMPTPGVVTGFRQPNGPGVRLDSGVEVGDEIGGQFDSLLAKLIVTGKDRTQALARARRALKEFTIEGIATVIPFHRAVIDEAAFIGDGETFDVHTRWIETEWDNTIEPRETTVPDGSKPAQRTFPIEVDGRRLSLTVPAELLASSQPQASQSPRRPRPSIRRGTKRAVQNASAVTAPMQGTMVKIAVEPGQAVEVGDLLVVLESMKMETPVHATAAGQVAEVPVTVGEFVSQNAVLVQFETGAEKVDA
jgi:acetyl-CoA/propionyl-CoA carboxylase biotin carboxyl carrier protein